MSNKLIHLLLAVSLGLNVGVIAMTLVHQPTRGHHPPPPGRGNQTHGPPPDPGQLVQNHLRGITGHLGLNPAQQREIRAVLEDHAPQLIRLQVDADEAGDRLVQAYAEPTFSPLEFRRLTAEASAARARLDSLSAVMLVAEAATLTPEQRRKFAEVAPLVHRDPGPPPREGGPPPR